MLLAVNNLPRRDFLVIIGSLTGVTSLSWAYLVLMARDMGSGGSFCMANMGIHGWSLGYFWMMFCMWAVMMAGMMVPSAAPMILIYAAVARKAQDQGTPIASSAIFTAGYIFMWTLFSLAVTLVQWQLDRAALISPMMVSNSPKFGAVLLIGAGIYQWLPAKNSCLEHCRSPFHFISSHWKQGKMGAWMMGVSHGTFCIGCCWALMLLLFVGGVMNILWISAITLFVLLEKLLPLGRLGGKISGILMVFAGSAVLVL